MQSVRSMYLNEIHKRKLGNPYARIVKFRNKEIGNTLALRISQGYLDLFIDYGNLLPKCDNYERYGIMESEFYFIVPLEHESLKQFNIDSKSTAEELTEKYGFIYEILMDMFIKDIKSKGESTIIAEWDEIPLMHKPHWGSFDDIFRYFPENLIGELPSMFETHPIRIENTTITEDEIIYDLPRDLRLSPVEIETTKYKDLFYIDDTGLIFNSEFESNLYYNSTKESNEKYSISTEKELLQEKLSRAIGYYNNGYYIFEPVYSNDDIYKIYKNKLLGEE